LPPSRASRLGLIAILALGFGYGWLMQGGGSLQNAHYVLVKSLAAGEASVTAALPEVGEVGTNDLARYKGKLYSNKAPGFAAAVVPAYVALREAGMRVTGDPARMLWALGLLGVVVPAVALLLLVRRAADLLEPGYGTAAAVTLGLCTLVLPFATLFYSHLLSAFLVFAAFVLLYEERRAGRSLKLVGAAGLLVGLATTVEYPNAIAGAVLGLYALTRLPWISRLLAYGAGFLAGIVPLLAYNQWAFGSPFSNSYDVAGGRADSLFGSPSVDVSFELLLSRQGLLTLTPVLVCALAGLASLVRRGARVEVGVIVAIALLYLAYDSAFYSPFGGFSPGPRYLLPVLPFLALALAPAFRSIPLTTTALAAVSGVIMVVLTATHPLAGYDHEWFTRLADRDVSLTVASLVDVTGWYTILPFFAAAALAAGCAVVATWPVDLRAWDAGLAALALAAWGVVFATAPASGRPGDYGWYLLVLAFVALVAVAASLRSRGLGRLAV
jgi:hypothetical protein